MEPGEKVRDSHRRLSKCSADFLDFAKENPGSKERSNFGRLVNFNSEYLQTQPWPTFINGETKKEIENAAVKVYKLIASIPERLFSFNTSKMAEYYCQSEEMIKLMLHGVDNDHILNILGRGDFVFSNDYELKCLEFNLNANLGGWEMDILEPLYMNTPVIQKFVKDYNVRLNKNQFFQLLFEFLIERALKRFSFKTGSEMHICLVFKKFIGGELDYYTQYLQEKFRAVLKTKFASLELKGTISVCLLDKLKMISDLLYVNGRRVHVLVDISGNKIPIVLMESVRKKTLMVYNGLVGTLMGNKLNLALLYEYQDTDLFSEEERETINKYIPWTRKVIQGKSSYKGEEIDLVDFILSNREWMVLKAAEGSGGMEVVPGPTVSPEEWKAHVHNALNLKATVVQELIQSPPYMYQRGENECLPHHAAWGFFVFGGKYAGGFVRLLPVRDKKIVINSKQGAEESMILEVEE